MVQIKNRNNKLLQQFSRMDSCRLLQAIMKYQPAAGMQYRTTINRLLDCYGGAGAE